MTAINRDVADSGLVLAPAAETPSTSSSTNNSSPLPSPSPSSFPSSVPSRPFQSRRDCPAARWQGDCHAKEEEDGSYEQDEYQEEERRGPWAAGTTLASPIERRPQSLSPQRTGPMDGIDEDGTVDSSPSVVTLVPLQDTEQQQQQPQQEPLQGQPLQVPQGKAPPLPQPQPQLVQQPFFVLDWWLEDLMLEQRQPVDAEHLATLLRTPTFNRRAPHPSQRGAANGKGSEEEEDDDDCSGGRVRRGSNQRKKNEPVAGSPLLRLLPWMRPQHEEENDEDGSDKTTQRNRPRQGGGRPWGWFPGTPQPRSHKSHANTHVDGAMESPTSCLSMPGTPKSSNRRRTLHPSKLGKKSRDNEVGTGSNSNNSNTSSHLPAPLCLQDKMDRAATTTGGCGGGTSRGAQDEEELRRRQEEEAALTERFRRKQQRQQERRKTQCIVQRSLTLAQEWTTKGLHKAHQEQWQDALNCWDNAYEIYSSLLGTNHLEVANVQNNRGIVLGRMGRVDEALEALEQAYEIRATHYQRCSSGGGGGDSHGIEDDVEENATATTTAATTSFTDNTAHDAIPVLIGTLHNIANVHQQAGDLATALSVFGRAKQEVMNLLIDMDRHQGLGGGGAGGQQQCPVRQQYQIEQLHHQSARLCTAMGHVYYDAQQWRDARDAYQDALEVYEHLVYDVWEKQQSAQQQAQSHSHTQSNNKSTKRNGYDKENRNTPNDEDQNHQYHRLTANDKALKAVVIQELVHLKKDIYELDKRCKRQQSDMIVTIQQQLLDGTATTTTRSSATTTRSSAPSRPVSCMAPSYGTNWDDCNYPWEDEDNDGEQYHPPHEHPSLDDLVVHGRRNPPRKQEATFLMIPSLATTPFPRG